MRSIQHPILILHAVLFEDRGKFGFECFFAVVLGLSLEIRGRGRDSGDADAEGAVSFLPFEFLLHWKFLMNPFRRISLDQLNRLGDRHRRWQREQNMHVILHATDRQRPHVVLFRDPVEIGFQTYSQVRSDQRTTLFRREDNMHETTDK